MGLLACLVFVGLSGYGDFREVWDRLVNFPAGSLVAALLLALVNYLLRFIRWAYYLKLLGIEATFSVSMLIFFTGLAMTITPGKVGELVKCFLLRERAGVPVASSVPVVVMERLTDLASIVLMGLVGLTLLPPVAAAFLVILLAGLALPVYLFTARRSDRIIEWPVLRRWSEHLREARQGMRTLARPIPVTLAVTLGFLSWVSEGVALWVVLKGLGLEVGALVSLPIYAGSVLAGAITTLPGGLVGTEGVMVALLQQAGAGRDVAAAGTLLVRVTTLWFAIGVGLAAFAVLHWIVRAPALPHPEESGVSRGLQLPDGDCQSHG